MAGSRAEKLTRLVRVQRQIERMAETQLSFTLREQVALEASQEALVGAVGSLDPVHAAMSHHYASRFQRLSAKSQQLEGMKSIQERKVMTEKTKADRLSGQADEAATGEERSAADEALLDLLDSSMAGRSTNRPRQ